MPARPPRRAPVRGLTHTARAQVQFAVLALHALADPPCVTWSAHGFLGAFAELRLGPLESALVASARVPLPGGSARPLLPLPYVLGLQATAAWLGARRRRAMRVLWRRAGLLEEWRGAEGAEGAGLVLRFDPAAARAEA